MAISNLHTLYGVDVNGIFINGVKAQSLSEGVQKAMLGSDGMIDDTFITTNPGEPNMTFSTAKIATALGAIGIDGLSLSAGSGIVLFWQKMINEGGRGTGSTHLKRAIAKGMIVPRRLVVDHGNADEARIEFEVAIISDGTNNPIIYSASQALSGTPGTSEAFTMGPFDFTPSGGSRTRYGGMQNYTLEFGIQLLIRGGDGVNFPTFVTIQQRQPVLTYRTIDSSLDQAIGAGGSDFGKLEIYLRKKAEAGGNELDSALAHFRISLEETLLVSQGGSANHAGETEFNGEASPSFDGTNAIIVMTPNIAVPAAA